MPHTYNDVDTFNNLNEPRRNTNSDTTQSEQTGERTMYTGTAWYKKQFTVTAEMLNKAVFIEFEGARQACKIWINGVPVQEVNDANYNDQLISENGFIPFGFSLNGYLTEGTNTITVWVNNSFNYTIQGGTDTDYIPWNDSHWQPTMGGLYRNVYLYTMSQTYLTLPLYSFLESTGTYVYTSDVTSTSATVKIDAEIGSLAEEAAYKVVAEILDTDGNVVATTNEVAVSVSSASKKVAKLTATVSEEDLRFWSDKYPYQYTAKVYLKDNAGNVLDSNENLFGIRTFRFTSDEGFFLNENYTKLVGYGQKPTNEWAGLGSAYPDYLHDYIMKKMKDGNANFIRYGHCAGGPADLAAAAKYGIIVMQPSVDGEGNYTAKGSGGVAHSYSTSSYQLKEDAHRDMVIYYRNNPAIMIWELGNNIENIDESYLQSYKTITDTYDYGNRPSAENLMTNSGTYENTTPSSMRMLSGRQSKGVHSDIVDINLSTIGSVSGTIQDKQIIEAEANRLETKRGLWDTYTHGFESWSSTDNVISTGYSSDTGYNTYANITGQEYCIGLVKSYVNTMSSKTKGGANWIFSDSTTHARLLTEVARASGEVDGVMLEKQAYYVNKILYSYENDSIIIGHWNYPANTTKSVYVVARGADEVNILVNGVSVGNAIGSVEDYFTGDKLLWKLENVDFASGEIEAVCKKQGVETSRATINSHGEPSQIKLTQVDTEVEAVANGSDVVLIDVEILDADGNRCITYDGQVEGKYVQFELTDPNGVVVFRGGYNSSVENSINKDYLYLEAGIDRISLKTTNTAGTFTLKAYLIDDVNPLSKTKITEIGDSNTLSITTQAFTEINGLSTQLPLAAPYNLATLSEVVYGDGNLAGEEDGGVVVFNETMFVEQTCAEDYEFGSLVKNAKVYKDLNTQFTFVPKKLQNSDFIRWNDGIKNFANSDNLLTFKTAKASKVFVLYDSSIPQANISTFITDNSFTKLTDQVRSGTTVYDVWVKDASANDYFAVTNIVSGEFDHSNNELMIIGIKELNEYNNEEYMNDDCSSSSQWHVRQNGTNLTATFENGQIVLYDNKTGSTGIAALTDAELGLTAVQRTFNAMSGKVQIDLKLKVTQGSYFRVWLNDGRMKNPGTYDNIMLESYITNGKLYYRTSAGGSSTLQISNVQFSYNIFYTIRYLVDTSTNKFSVYIKEDTTEATFVEKATNLSMTKKKDNSYGSAIGNVCLGTGGNNDSAMTMTVDNVSANYYVEDEFEVTGINVGGTAISGFVSDTTNYTVDTEFLGVPEITATYSNSLPVDIFSTLNGNVVEYKISQGGFEYTYYITLTNLNIPEITGIYYNGVLLDDFDQNILEYNIPSSVHEIPVITSTTNCDDEAVKTSEIDYQNGAIIYTISFGGTSSYVYTLNLTGMLFLNYETQLLENVYLSSSTMGGISVEENLGVGSRISSNGSVSVTGMSSRYLNASFFTINEGMVFDSTAKIYFTPVVDVILTRYLPVEYGHIDIDGWTKTNNVLIYSNNRVFFCYEKVLSRGVLSSILLSELYVDAYDVNLLITLKPKEGIESLFNSKLLVENLENIEQVKFVYDRYFDTLISDGLRHEDGILPTTSTEQITTTKSIYDNLSANNDNLITVSDGSKEYVFELNDKDAEMAIIQTEIPKQTAKFELSLQVYLDNQNAANQYTNSQGSSASNSQNKYFRVWLLQGAPMNGYAADTTNPTSEKMNVFAETYFTQKDSSGTNSSFDFSYRRNSDDKDVYVVMDLPSNNWYKIIYTIDVKTKEMNVLIQEYNHTTDEYQNIKYNESTYSATGSQSGAKTIKCAHDVAKSNLTEAEKEQWATYDMSFIDHIQIASGRNATALAYIKGLTMKAVSRGITSSISIQEDGESAVEIDNFSEITTAYAYQVSQPIQPTITATTIAGYTQEVLFPNGNESLAVLNIKDDEGKIIQTFNIFLIYPVNVDSIEAELNKKADLLNLQTTYNEWTTTSWDAYILKWNQTKTQFDTISDAITAGTNELTQFEIDTIASELRNAREALVLADDTAAKRLELSNEIAIKNTLTEAHYSTETWATYISAWNTAKLVADDEDASKSQIIPVLDPLKTAREALVNINLDFTNLNNLIATIGVGELIENNYTSSTWNNLQTVLTTVNNTKNSASNQTEIDDLQTDLQTAIDGLIEKHKIEITDAMLTNLTKVYGTAESDITISIAGQGEDGAITITLTRETGETAGLYDITGIASVSNTDYIATLQIGAGVDKFEITQATYDMSEVDFDFASFVYNGEERTLEITGTLPVGVTVSYTTNTLTNVGSVEVTASFTGDATNYQAIPSKNATLTITVRAITITANSKTVIYGEDVTLAAEDVTIQALSGDAGLIASDIFTGGSVTTDYVAGDEVSNTTRTTTASGYVNANYQITYIAGNVTINKKIVTALEYPVANSIYFGARLSGSSLNGGDNTKGSFNWENEDITPSVDNVGYNVVFTPNDADNYDWTQVELIKQVAINVLSASVNIPYGIKIIGSESGELSGENSYVQNGETLSFVFVFEDEYQLKKFTINGVESEESDLIVVDRDNDIVTELILVVVKEDKQSGILVESDKDNISGDLTLNIEIITSTEDKYTEVQNIVGEDYKLKVFDIVLADSSGQISTPSKAITLKIKIPDGFDASKIVFYRIEGNQKIELAHQIEGNSAIIMADHFSVYVVAEKITHIEEPELLNVALIVGLSIVGLALASIITIIIIFNKRKKLKFKNK